MVYVSAIGPLWSAGGDRGLFKTTDGGQTWKAVLTVSADTGVTDVLMDPKNPDVLYAAALQRRRAVGQLIGGGPESGLYKSTNAGQTWTKLTKGLPTADEKMTTLMTQRRIGFGKAKPDAKLGAAVFKTNCANCHQLGGEGAKVGPQLDGVGVRGLDRLLEDILDPSRNVDQAMRTTILNLKDGKSASGLLLREEGELFVLADNQGKEMRVPKADVEDLVKKYGNGKIDDATVKEMKKLLKPKD